MTYVDADRDGQVYHLRDDDVFVADRDKCRSDYEEKLRHELEQVRVRTDVEMDRLKTSTRDMYERENRFQSVSLM